ncbi:MAG: GNAT family N-acetyltransferase [Candidatus Lokiarchaeota archaeon]|nr:GNAT family N-acetyltransferase [Candidatus Lokiarchaeota archaeon]
MNKEKDILIIRQPCDKQEYEEMYELRYKVLREPWNQPKGTEKDKLDLKDDGVYPFIALKNNDIVGTARFHRDNEHEGQIRYLAVKKEYRGQGIAKNLLDHIEWYAISLGIPYLKLNARKNVQELFEKLNYKEVAEGPTLFKKIERSVMGKQILDIM